MTRTKIRSLTTIKKLIPGLRRSGKKIVLANGCFDVMHVGHVRYLAGAKSMGDILVVGINGDRSVRHLKGSGRPLMPEKVRAELVAGCSVSDYVVVFQETHVERLLRTLRPDIHAKGSDYTPDTVPERDIVKSLGGRVAIVGGPKVRSTRDLIRKIKRVGRRKPARS